MMDRLDKPVKEALDVLTLLAYIAGTLLGIVLGLLFAVLWFSAYPVMLK
jgi:ABC-type amino acid transport system permease subunit